MKRTREAINKPHPDWVNRSGVSGLRDFDGEDLDYDARIQYNKQQQKAWLEEQMREKQLREQQEKLEESHYAQQTYELTRMRGMLEDDFNQNKKNIKMNVVQSNLQKAQDQRDTASSNLSCKLKRERDEIDETIRRGQKLPYP